MRRFSDLFERASIDEAFLDVTAAASAACASEPPYESCMRGAHNERVEEMLSYAGDVAAGSDAWTPDVSDAFDVHLLAGARICNELRAAVAAELGYTVSGGIAHNKVCVEMAACTLHRSRGLPPTCAIAASP